MTNAFRVLLGAATLVLPAIAAGAELQFVQAQKNGVGGVLGLTEPLGIAVSPDGASVYVAGSDDGAVAVFRRDPATGMLAFLEIQQGGSGHAHGHHVHSPGGEGHGGRAEGLEHPIGLTSSPDGRHVYVASTGADAVAVFARDAATGQLTFVEAVKEGVGGVAGLGQARAVAVSPDGMSVYAGGPKRPAIAVFARDPLSGKLTFVQAQRNGVGGVDGLTGLSDIVVTPEGAHVIVAANGDSALAVFGRDGTTGALTFSQVVKDGVNGVDGLGLVRGLAVSPDGMNVYAASPTDSAVSVFHRNAATGSLAFVEVKRDRVGGVKGLSFATKVTVSPEGKAVYVAANGDSAVTVFGRDVTTGELTYLESHKNGQDGVGGIGGAFWLAPSSDGRHLYVAGFDGNEIGVFARLPGRGSGAASRQVEAIAAAGLVCAFLGWRRWRVHVRTGPARAAAPRAAA